MERDYIPNDIGEFNRLLKFFNDASDTLKYPRMRLQLGDYKFAVLVRVAKGKFPGSIRITDGNDNSILFGFIGLNGQWIPTHHKLSRWVYKELKKLLNSTPSKLKAYSDIWSKCCFCNKDLTDYNSIKVGYGETCSKNWKIHNQWKRK